MSISKRKRLIQGELVLYVHSTFDVPPSEELICVADCCKQSFASECDINSIMKRYERTGVLEHVAAISPQYADVFDVPDFAVAMQIVNAGETAFGNLPAVMRDRFGNDALAFMAFVDNPANFDEGVRLGIFEAPASPTISTPPVVDSVAS